MISLILVLRLNVTLLGVSDLVFVILSSLVSDTMSLAFSLLPTLVLFTKITPTKIEASVFALLTGVSNFSNGVASPIVGSFVCRMVGVDSENLDKYSTLLMI
jgi:hypothetical protein